MSFFTFGFPVESLLPLANGVIGAASTAARPLIGLGVFATLLVLFKPLLTGMFRAATLLISPRKSLDQRRLQQRVDDQLQINLLARSLEAQHPGLASELRSIAMRD